MVFAENQVVFAEKVRNELLFSEFLINQRVKKFKNQS